MASEQTSCCQQTEPRLWTPEQLRQMKTPRLTDAHVGPRAWQSAHRLLSSCLSNSARTRFCSSFCALLTAFLLLLMMELWL
jgi:hypothetical protein